MVLLQPTQDIEVGGHQGGDQREAAEQVSDQDHGDADEQPTADGPFDDILLFGGLCGKGKGVHLRSEVTGAEDPVNVTVQSTPRRTHPATGRPLDRLPLGDGLTPLFLHDRLATSLTDRSAGFGRTGRLYHRCGLLMGRNRPTGGCLALLLAILDFA